MCVGFGGMKVGRVGGGRWMMVGGLEMEVSPSICPKPACL